MLTYKNQKWISSFSPDFGAEVEVLWVRIQQHVGLHNQGVHRLVKVRDDCSATTHLIGGVCLQRLLSLVDSSLASELVPLIGGPLHHHSQVDFVATAPLTGGPYATATLTGGLFCNSTYCWVSSCATMLLCFLHPWNNAVKLYGIKSPEYLSLCNFIPSTDVTPLH